MSDETFASTAGQGLTVRRSGIRRAIIAATIGTVIEWFDYALYTTAAGLVINRLFFPQLSPVAGTLAAFATFAVGFFIRPLGGIVISHIGDRFGRKPALIFSVSLMGGATVAMGLLPTYAQIGLAAPIILVVLRIAQGFGAGAEYAGAVTLIAEYVPERHKGMLTGLMQSASALGVSGAFLAFLAAAAAPEDMLLTWTWRVPFIASAVLFIVALYIRARLDETPEYVEAMERAAVRRREESIPLVELLRNSPREVLWGFLSVSGHNAHVYLLNAFAINYLTATLGMPRTLALLAATVGSFVGVLTTPLSGAISDRVGYNKVYMFGMIFVCVYIIPLFAMFGTKNPVLVVLGMIIGYGVAFAGTAGSQAAFLASLFGTRTRFSGIAMCREINAMVVAGPTPFIATALVAVAGGSPNLAIGFIMAMCVLSLVSILAVQRRAIHRSTIQEDAIVD
jgi:MFS family permease